MNVRVFISSPSDLMAERKEVEDVISELNNNLSGRVLFSLVKWENEYYTASKDFQEQIPRPSSCDIVVVILWKRLGTVLPERYCSADGRFRTGTEYEFEEALDSALERGRPDVLVYRKVEQVFFSAERVDIERAEYAALSAFWQKWFNSEDGHFIAGFDKFLKTDQFAKRFKEHLELWISRHSPGAKWPVALKGSPFRSLEPFDRTYSDVFFGRSRVTRRIVARLQTCAARKHPFMLLLGKSGVGKSSLAQAGVLPALTRPGSVASVKSWRTCVIKPGSLGKDLLLGLADSLFSAKALPELKDSDHSDPSALANLMASSPASCCAPISATLLRICKELKTKLGTREDAEVKLVVLIDQFEEVFQRDLASQLQLAGVIQELVKCGVFVVCTMRSDFYDRLQTLPQIISLTSDGGIYDVLSPEPAEFREIINKPAEMAGLCFEQAGERSLSDLLEAASREQNSLPLLEYTLDALFSEREGQLLTLRAYDALGGLEGAIAREAEKLFERLPATSLSELPDVLLALCDVDEDTGDIRSCPTSRSKFADARQVDVLDSLILARLVVVDGTAGDAILRLAHESLFIHWPFFAGLIRDHLRLLRLKRRIVREAKIWEQEGEDADLLLTSMRKLGEASEILSEKPQWLDSITKKFIVESQAAEAARQRSEEIRKKQEVITELERAKKRARDVAIFASSVGLMLVLCFSALVYASSQYFRAHRELVRADSNLYAALESGVMLSSAARDLVSAGQIAASLSIKLLDPSRVMMAKLQNDSANENLGPLQWQISNALSIAYTSLPGQGTNLLKTTEEEIVLARRIVESRPDDQNLKQKLAATMLNRAIALDIDGKLDDARAVAEDALKLLGTITTSPDRMRIASKLYARLGDIFNKKRQTDIATLNFEKMMDLCSQLVNYPNPDPDWQRGLALSYERLGDTAAVAGHHDDAFKFYQRYLEEARNLIKFQNTFEPNITWTLDLAIAHQRIGNIYLKNGNFELAHEEFTSFQADVRAALSRDPNNGDWNRYLANSHIRLGDVEIGRNNPEPANQQYKEANRLFKGLTEKDSIRASWRRGLALSHQRLAISFTLLKLPSSARKELETCRQLDFNEQAKDFQIDDPEWIKKDCEVRLEQMSTLNND